MTLFRPKILIVDDKPANLKALRGLLRDINTDILEASSGNDALGMMVENDLALVLLDVEMPGMDGFEVADMAQSVERTRHTPILFITAAYRDDMHRIKGYRSGAADYIEKPIQEEILIAKVRIFLDLFTARKEVEITNQKLQQEIEVRKGLERELQEMNEGLERLVEERTSELERSNQDLQQFAYAASHDLQEPLRLISGYVQLLEKQYKGNLDEKADKFIFYITDGARHMQELVNSLLSYSRVGTHGEPFVTTRCDDALDQALVYLQGAIRNSEATITRAPLPTLQADRTQLVQIFQNLIGNAIKFQETGSRPVIHVSARQEGEEWIFSVEDNGIGIEKKFVDRVFLIFQKLHARSKFSGTGIGLALCKRIVERHGGQIWIESAPEQGSILRFSLRDMSERDGNGHP